MITHSEIQKPILPEKDDLSAILRRRKNSEGFRLSRPEVTDTHVRMVWQEAHQRHAEFPTFDMDEMVSDGFWGLCIAWAFYDEVKGGGAPFEFFARMKIKTYVWNGIRREMNRRRILNPFTLTAVEAIADQTGKYPRELTIRDISEIVQDQDDLMELVKALKDEKPVVQEAVLRTEKDVNLAKKYGYKSQVSILNYRRRFLNKFLRQLGRPPFI